MTTYIKCISRIHKLICIVNKNELINSKCNYMHGQNSNPSSNTIRVVYSLKLLNSLSI